MRERREYCHPRGWGTMVRAIVEFTKRHPILTLEELIHKNTQQAAERYRLGKKGVIRDGYDADLVLFDYDALTDNATYKTPTALASGIEAVFVFTKRELDPRRAEELTALYRKAGFRAEAVSRDEPEEAMSRVL